MNNGARIREAILGLQGKRGELFHVGEITKVGDETCEVRLSDELTLSDVQLSPVINGEKNNLIIKPKKGSKVLFADLSDGELRSCVVISVTEIEEICIDNGDNGGLVKIEKLTEKINSLVDWCKDHKHSGVVVNVTGGSGAPALGVSGNSGSPVTQPKTFDKSDYENEKIKH